MSVITNREWDEMRVAQKMRLDKLREEITIAKMGNRLDREGVGNGTEQQSFGQPAQSGQSGPATWAGDNGDDALPEAPGGPGGTA